MRRVTKDLSTRCLEGRLKKEVVESGHSRLCCGSVQICMHTKNGCQPLQGAIPM